MGLRRVEVSRGTATFGLLIVVVCIWSQKSLGTNMNLEQLKNDTALLKAILERIALEDEYAVIALRVLGPLFKDIESGKFQRALSRDELPTPGVLHHSSRLRIHEDLENAWYSFQSSVTGGFPDDNPIIKALRSIDNQ